jgi:uncharacterized protein (TIGR02118 family)
MVLYPPQENPDHFRQYYINHHLPMARQLPKLKEMRYSMTINALEGDSPFFCIWEADFESFEDMIEAIQSEQGQKVAQDVPNYATGEIKIIHFPINQS